MTKNLDARGERFAPWVALAVLVSCLFANQYTTLRRFKRFVLSVTADQPTDSIQTGAVKLLLDHWREVLAPIDLVIGALILLALGYLVYAEIARRSLSGILVRADSSRGVRYGLLALGALAAGRSYLNPGEVFMGDSEAHTLRTFMLMEHLRALEAPVWSNYWYGGYPFMGYYAPLFYSIAAPLGVLLGDLHLAIKLELFAAHVASMLFMFWFLREASGRTHAAMLGAFAYGFVFHRIHIVLYRGDLNISLVFALYPVLFLMMERYFNRRGSPKLTFIVFALALAGLILNHHGYGFFGGVLAGLYLLVRTGLTPLPWRERAKALSFFGLAALSAGVISAFSLIPYVVDAPFARGMREGPFELLIPNWRVPILLYQRFFRSPVYYMFHWTLVGDAGNIGYIGLSIGIFALIAVPFVVKRRIPSGIGLLVCCVTTLFMMRNFIDFNIKNTNFIVFFISGLAGFSGVALESLMAKRALLKGLAPKPATVTLVLLALLLLDLGPTTFHSVYREDYDFKPRMFARIQAIDGNHKAVERRLLKYVPGPEQEKYYEPGSLGVLNAHDRIFTPLGRFHEGAGMSMGYAAEMVKNLERDLHHDRISELSLVGLYLMDVKYITFRHRYGYYSPELAPSPEFTLEEGLLTLQKATPLILSRRVVSASDVEGYDPENLIEKRRYFDTETYDHRDPLFREIVVPLIEKMGVDRRSGVAEALIAHSREKDLSTLGTFEDGEDGEDGEAGELETEVLQFSADIRTVSVRYRSNRTAAGQLAFTYFPYLEVAVDGKPTPFFRSAMHNVLLPLPAGEHVVTVRGVASTSRKWSFLLSSVFLVLFLAVPRRWLHAIALEPAVVDGSGA